MAENVIDTLKLDIIVNTKQNGQSITTLKNSLEKLYKFLNGVNNQDLSKVSNDISKLANAVNSLNTQGVKNLNSLSNALKKIKEFTAGMATQDVSSLDKNLTQVASSLTKFVSSLNSLDETGLKNIKTISSLSTLSSGLNRLDKTIDGLDVEKLKKRFLQMAEAIDPFITKVSSAKESLVALNGVISGSNKLTKSTTIGGGVGNKLGKTLNFGSMIAKLYFIRNITKQLGQNLAKVVQYGIDYEETLNLWQVAMKGNISQARTFVSEMRNAYGIASATLMNYQATFKNMLSALDGLNEDVAYGLSEALTGMALDYASLYNTSIESAMTKFQAVLAGQVRPIRSESGYDITESTIFGIYQELGGTKSVRQLDQMEKRLLRILAVYKQMQNTATGDLAKTITSSANQLRVMKEQSQEFATWIGVAFNTLLEKSGILIEINAYLYALSELAEQFAISLGYVEKDYSIKEPIDEANTALDGANEKVDELQGKLLGFDKFQVLSTGNVDNGNVDLAAEITKAIQEYERIINDAENPAFKRSLELLQAWGLELDENGKIVGGFDNVKEKVTDIAKSLGGIITFIGFMTKPWMVFVGAIEYAYWTNEEFRDSMNELLTQLGGTGLTVFQELAEIFIDIAPVLVEIVDGFAGIIGWLDEMELLDDVIWLVVGALMAWKTVNIVKSIQDTYKLLQPMITKLQGLATQFTLTQVAAAGMAALGFMVAYDAAKNLFSSWDDMSGLERAIEIFKLLAGAAMVAAVAVGVFHTSWTVGVAAATIAAGVAVLMGYMASVKSQAESLGKIETHANGGLATKGSLFIAGEAGPELVTKTSGGNSTIMNMQQLNDAVRLGFIGGLKSAEFADFKDDLSKMIATTTPMALVSKGINKIFGFANGGLADKGSLFYAGEAGPELVTQTSGGGSTIMNMKQLEDAVARGFIRGIAATDNGNEDNGTTEIYVDGQKMFEVFTKVAKRNGYELVKI